LFTLKAAIRKSHRPQSRNSQLVVHCKDKMPFKIS